MSNQQKTLHCLLALVLTVSVNAAGAVEIDPNWSPDLSSYAPAPNNWPLCGLSGPLSPSSCTSTAPDRMVSTYGPRNQTAVGYDFHRGIDLRTENMELDNNSSCGLGCIPHRQTVFAVAAGTVDKITFKCKGGEPDGFRIRLEHGTPSARWYTRYVHLSSVSPLANPTPPVCASGSNAETEYPVGGLGLVVAGAPIGWTGKSVSNNHHLHFEVRKDEKWARSAVHPVRKLPAIASPGKLGVSLSDPPGGPFTIDVKATRLDVTRVQLQAAQCGIAGCGPYQDVDPGPQPNGYYQDPPFYDYELFNYQYSHRGNPVWDSTFCFQSCPFSSVHPWVTTPAPAHCLHGYSSGFHINDATFNSVTVTPGSTLPVYIRKFELLATPAPVGGQICTRAVALTAGGAQFESAPVCFGP